MNTVSNITCSKCNRTFDKSAQLMHLLRCEQFPPSNDEDDNVESLAENPSTSNKINAHVTHQYKMSEETKEVMVIRNNILKMRQDKRHELQSTITNAKDQIKQSNDITMTKELEMIICEAEREAQSLNMILFPCPYCGQDLHTKEYCRHWIELYNSRYSIFSDTAKAKEMTMNIMKKLERENRLPIDASVDIIAYLNSMCNKVTAK